MRSSRTLSLYLAREMLLFVALCFAGTTFVLLCQQLLERLDSLLEVGLDPPNTAFVLAKILSILAPHAIPMSFAFGVTLAVGRLASQREILAMRALGNGLRVLALPVAAIAASLALATGWLVRDAEPRARVELRQTLTELALRGSLVEAGRFRGVDDRVLFVDDRTASGELRGIMIYDRSRSDRPFALFARGGRLESDATPGVLELELEDGTISVDAPAEEGARVQSVRFEKARYSVVAASLLDDRHARRNPDELAFRELFEVIERIDAGAALEGVRKPRRDLYELEVHRRLAAPCAVLGLGLAALGIGANAPRRSRALASLACALCVVGFYALASFGEHLTREYRVDAALASWAPVALLAFAAAALLWRADRAGEP